jgi:hypothetical protein
MSGLRKIIANNVIYDNASSGLTADTVQEAIDEISDASITINAKVNTFANLPAASLHNDQIYLVEQYSTGHLSGLYYSDGSNWTFRDDKITYSINAFTGTNKVLKVNSTSTKEIIETDIEIDSSNNLDLKAGGLKDSNVSTAVKLGSATDTSLTTTKKDILGGINENKSNIDLKANDNAVVHLAGNETIADVKTFSSSPIVPTPTTDMQASTKKYVDDNNKMSFVETATCSTASATEAKTATLTNFSLTTGIKFRITFSNTNTGAAPTLNINSTGAKPIADENGNAASATYPFLVKAGTTVEFTYDGTNFVYTNKVVKNYKSTNDWYRIWSNGFIEQGSVFSLSEDHDDYSVTLLLAFVDGYYNLLTRGNYVTNTNGATNQGVSRIAGNWNTRSTTAFTMATSVVDSAYIWEAKGF